MAAGAFHNLALQENGQVLAWGRNEYGSLGLGDTVFMSKPTAISYFIDHSVKVKVRTARRTASTHPPPPSGLVVERGCTPPSHAHP